MSLLKVNEVQNYNGSSLTLTASTVSTSAQLNTGGNISVTGSINVSDDSTTRSNLGLGSIATQDSDNVTVTGGTATLGALTVSGSDSGDLVRITQTGSGNALVVEDDTNPDSTPFVVDASGNVGIGTSSPSVKLEISRDQPLIRLTDTDTVLSDGEISSGIEFYQSDASGAGVGASIGAYSQGSTGLLNLRFATGANTEAMRIDSSGNVGIGTSSPTSSVTIRDDSSGSKVELLRLENLGGGSNEGSSIGFYSDDGIYAEIESSHSTYNYGSLQLRAYDNDHSTVASEIRLAGTTGTTDDPYISFTTNASERMRIDSAGQINMYDVYNDTVTGRDLYIASTGKLGYLSSIRAAKTNISNLESVTWLYSLNPVLFQYRTKDEEDNYTDIPEEQIEYGLIAEEVETVNSDLVFYDETENGLELRGVQYSRLIAPLIKAVQQQKTLIESQQSQIDALTARIDALETA